MTHTSGEEYFKSLLDYDEWPPFTQTPECGNNGFQRNNSLGSNTGLTNSHQNLGYNFSDGLTQLNNRSTQNNVGQYNLQYQQNLSLLCHQSPTFEGLTCAPMAKNQMEYTNRLPSELEVAEKNHVGTMSTTKETKKGRGKGKGRKRKGKGPAEKAKATFGEESKILFVVGPLHDNMYHDVTMISSNIHHEALWNYLKTYMKEDTDDLFGEVGMDGSISFGDELMIVAMEFLCSLFDMRNGITYSGVDVRRRITEKQYSTGIISLLNVCHFMSAR